MRIFNIKLKYFLIVQDFVCKIKSCWGYKILCTVYKK